MLEHKEFTESRDLKKAIIITVEWWDGVLKKHSIIDNHELVKRSISVSMLLESLVLFLELYES